MGVAVCIVRRVWNSRGKISQREKVRGFKLGYDSGERDSSKAKCKIKVCCFRERGLATFADCSDYPCEALSEFWSKKGWKHQQYRKQLELIGQNGYAEFLKRADKWKGSSGKLEVT